MYWWHVTVFDPVSHSTTTLGMMADDVEEIKHTLEEDGLWVYVSAQLDVNENK